MTLVDQFFGEIRHDALRPAVIKRRDALVKRRYLGNSH